MLKKIAFFVLLMQNLILCGQIYLGINAGINSSKVRFDKQDLKQSFKYIGKPHINLNAGINGQFYFAKTLNLKTELKYTVKGYKYDQGYTYGHKTLNYIQMSAAGQIDLNPDNNIIFAPFMGAYTAYWIAGKRFQVDIKAKIIEKDIILLKKDSAFAYNRYDSGIITGIELKFNKHKKRKFVIGTMYELGMVTTDIKKVDGWKNRNFTIYLEIYFRVKKRNR